MRTAATLLEDHPSPERPLSRAIVIHTLVTGALGQNVDWWELVTDAHTGTRVVIHCWRHVDLYRQGEINHGRSAMTLGEFAAGKYGDLLADAIARSI